jgi:hypothetical protein
VKPRHDWPFAAQPGGRRLKQTPEIFPSPSEFENCWIPAKISAMKGRIILSVIFVAAFALSRIPGLLPPNFSAAYAFAFCAGVYFRGALAWWLPLGVMLATDIGLNFYYQHTGIDPDVWSAGNLANLAINYAAYAVLILLGGRFKPQKSLLKLLGGGLLGAILFYFLTNTASWFFNPFHNLEYTKNLAGWIKALTYGTNGYPPTWEFFRNTLLSGGLFTALFAASAKLTAESPAEKTAGQREPKAEGEPAAEPEAAQP